MIQKKNYKFDYKTIILVCAIFCAIIISMNFSIKNLYCDNSFSAPTYFQSTTPLTSKVIIAKVNENCYLYSENSISSSNILVEIDSKILIINANIEEDENLSYVLYSTNQAEYFGYLPKNKYQTISILNEEKAYCTFYNNVKIYKYPSASSGIVNNVSEQTAITVNNNCASYQDYKDNLYYCITYNGTIGYILQESVITSGNFEPTKIINNQNVESNVILMLCYVVTVVALFIGTIFVCVKLLKRKNNNEK